MTTLRHGETPSAPTKLAICPKCGEVGFVHARTDAYVNRLVPADGDIDFSASTDVSEFGETIYECFHCSQSLEWSEIATHNGFPERT